MFYLSKVKNHTVKELRKTTRVPTIYMEKMEIAVGKFKWFAHSLREISENMGLDFRRWNISSFLVFLAYLDVLCNWSFSHFLKFYSFIFIHKISSPVVCVNAMHPHVNNFYMSGQRKHIVILGFWVLIRLGFENTSPALQTSAYYRSI